MATIVVLPTISVTSLSFIGIAGTVKDIDGIGVSRSVMAFREDSVATIQTFGTSDNSGNFSLRLPGFPKDKVTVLAMGAIGENNPIAAHCSEI